MSSILNFIFSLTYIIIGMCVSSLFISIIVSLSIKLDSNIFLILLCNVVVLFDSIKYLNDAGIDSKTLYDESIECLYSYLKTYLMIQKQKNNKIFI